MRQKCKSMGLNGFIPKIFLKMYAEKIKINAGAVWELPAK